MSSTLLKKVTFNRLDVISTLEWILYSQIRKVPEVAHGGEVWDENITVYRLIFKTVIQILADC